MTSYARVNELYEVVEVIEATPEQVASGACGDPNKLFETASGNWKQELAAGRPILRRYKASGGMIYDPQRDAFYWKKPEGNWNLNETTLLWEPA